MSHTYDLICVKCREDLSLGKAVRLNEKGEPIPWTWTGWRGHPDGARVEGFELWEAVARFLLLHRGHELRVVPSDELMSRLVDPEGKFFSHIHYLSELMDRPVEPEPDPEEDAARCQFEVFERVFPEE